MVAGVLEIPGCREATGGWCGKPWEARVRYFSQRQMNKLSERQRLREQKYDQLWVSLTWSSAFLVEDDGASFFGSSC